MKMLLGERAEFLAYCRSAIKYGDSAVPFPEFQAALRTTSGPVNLSDRFTGGSMTLTREQFNDFLWMILADWIDKTSRDPAWEEPAVYAEIAARLNAAAQASFDRVCAVAGLLPQGRDSENRWRKAA